MSEWQLIVIVVLVAGGFFGLGMLYQHRKYMTIWQAGFDAGKKLMEQRR